MLGRPGPTYSPTCVESSASRDSRPEIGCVGRIPSSLTRGNAHGPLLTGAANAETLDFLDQWSWVQARAGGVTDDVAMPVRRGREAASEHVVRGR